MRHLLRDLCGFLLLAVSSCAALSAEESYTLGSGDKVRIAVFKHPDLETLIRIGPSGNVSVPLLGSLQLEGLTEREAEKKIAERLASGGFVMNPQVTVSIEEYASRQASVLGYVNEPGKYVIPRSGRIVDLVALAGGIKDDGDDRVVLTRHGTNEIYEIDLMPILAAGRQDDNREVIPYDVLYVPPMRQFYIYGAVDNAGAFRLKGNMTVMQALALAGGLYVEGSRAQGSENNIEIHRIGADGKNEVIKASLETQVLADDVIRVKERLF